MRERVTAFECPAGAVGIRDNASSQRGSDCNRESSADAFPGANTDTDR